MGARRSLSGSVAAVTGGGRGIGLATARALAAAGARVAIGDLDGDLAASQASEFGGMGVELDVTRRESFEDFVERVEAELGPLDVLVNNAGIMPIGPFVDEADDVAARQVDINVHGVILGMKIALPGMLQRGRGHIVNIASAAGKGGFPGGATYCATKHAVVGLSEAVRMELEHTPLEVSVVMPAVVNTELASGLQRSRFVKAVEPEDVAQAIVQALERPRFDVFVPRSIGPLSHVIGVLPRRTRERLGKLLGGDRVLADADPAARADYERRAAESEPARPPA